MSILRRRLATRPRRGGHAGALRDVGRALALKGVLLLALYLLFFGPAHRVPATAAATAAALLTPEQPRQFR